ncbi:response regulator [Mucilaginibacter gynuensis]|uniref:Response regulator n=1 Tax=Mucilaginibacter gynuensis TaxID=1302236 RepID=A0ABP8G1W0_9SPHI
MCKAIVIDDNPMEHMIIQRMFESYDVFPDAVHSTDGAMVISFMEEYYNETDILPDLIFLDLNMPYTGWDFLVHLENLLPSLHKQPDVFVVTSSIDINDKLKAAQYACVKGYISKPLKRETLTELAATYLPEKRIAS